MTAHFTITNASSLDPRNRDRTLSVFECECTGDICQYGHLDIHQEIVKEGSVTLGGNATHEDFIGCAHAAGLITARK